MGYKTTQSFAMQNNTYVEHLGAMKDGHIKSLDFDPYADDIITVYYDQTTDVYKFDGDRELAVNEIRSFYSDEALEEIGEI